MTKRKEKLPLAVRRTWASRFSFKCSTNGTTVESDLPALPPIQVTEVGEQ